MNKKRIFKAALLLFVAVLLFLIIGATVPFLKTKKVEHTTEADQLVEQVLTERTSPDRAMVLETNESALEERIRLINMAKQNIVLTTFDMREGESTSDLLSILYKKAKEGVHVQILVDGINGFTRMENVPLFLVFASHKNVDIKFYNPVRLYLPWKLMGRMHDKYLIVDHTAYILGGRNTFDYFLGNYETDGKSYDREALVFNTQPHNKESSIYQLYDYFNKLWNSDLCVEYQGNITADDVKEYDEFLKVRYESVVERYSNLLELYDYTLSTHATQGVTLLANDTQIYSKEPTLFYELVSLMKQAKNKVVIHTPYAVFDEYMTQQLEEVSKQVPVTMMVNARENGDNLVASSDYTYHRGEIQSMGASILEYVGGTSYHGKSLVIDDNIAIIGSFNFDMRSTYVDTELMLAINSKEVTSDLNAYMDKLQADCRDISKNSEEDLSFGRKVVFRSLGLIMQAFRVLI